MQKEKEQTLAELMSFSHSMILQSKEQILYYFDLCRKIASTKQVILLTSKTTNDKLFSKKLIKIKKFIGYEMEEKNIINTTLKYGQKSGMDKDVFKQMANFKGHYLMILETPRRDNVMCRHHGYIFEIGDNFDETYKEKRFTQYLAEMLYYLREDGLNKPQPKHPFYKIDMNDIEIEKD